MRGNLPLSPFDWLKTGADLRRLLRLLVYDDGPGDS
jgi:hypothetical protein